MSPRKRAYQLARNIHRYWLNQGYAVAVWVEEEDGIWVIRSTLRGGLPDPRDRIRADERIVA